MAPLLSQADRIVIHVWLTCTYIPHLVTIRLLLTLTVMLSHQVVFLHISTHIELLVQ